MTHRHSHNLVCAHCTVVAGEFAFQTGFEAFYSSEYRNTLVCQPTSKTKCPARYWAGLPTVWGFHDYRDLKERNPDTAQSFATCILKRLGKPKLIMSEAGVALRNGEETTNLWEGDWTGTASEPVPKAQRAHAEGRLIAQAEAAETFRRLPEDGLALPIDRMYYYQYLGPTEQERVAQGKPDLFDTALLKAVEPHMEPDRNPGEVDRRPAYCVLAFSRHACPPTPEKVTHSVLVTFHSCGGVAAVQAVVDPNGSATTYDFEYGTTTSMTSFGRTASEGHTGHGWLPVVVKGELPLEETAPDQCREPTHFRLVAHNAAASQKSLGANVKIEYISNS